MANYVNYVDLQKPLCPLIRDNPRKCFFAENDLRLWWPPAPNPFLEDHIIPGAASVGASLNIGLTLPQSAPQPLQALINTQVLLKGIGHGNVVLAESSPFTIAKAGTLTVATVSLKTSIVPWIIKDNVTWTLSDAKNVASHPIGETALEIYILSSHLPQYIINNGLPTGLFEIPWLVPAWMAAKSGGEWEKFVIQALFNSPSLWYDTFSGRSKYTSGSNTFDATANCWLELFTSDMLGLVATKNKRYAVNCADFAAISQTLIALGYLGNVSTDVKMVFLSPYGFINQTKLMGRTTDNSVKNPDGYCNNPFYNSPWSKAQMRVDNPNDPDRTAFWNHWFLQISDPKTKEERIWDATCGPVLGTEKPQDYVQNAIDHSCTLYGKPYKIPRPGNWSDAKIGPGVMSLHANAAFRGTSPTDPNHNSLFTLMESEFVPLAALGKLKPPVESATLGGVVATWTFISTVLTCTFYINIYYFPNEDGASAKYGLIRADLDKSSVTAASTGYSLQYDDGLERFAMFAVPVAPAPAAPVSVPRDGYYLVTVQGPKGTGKAWDEPGESGNIANVIMANIIPKIKRTDSPNISPPLYNFDPAASQFPVQREFKINVQAVKDGTAVVSWRGYQVLSHYNFVLLLGAELQQDKSIQFRFYARRAGQEIVWITMYDANLETKRIWVPVNIT